MLRGRGTDDERRGLAVGADEAEEGCDPSGAEAVVAALPLGLEAVPRGAGDDDRGNRGDAGGVGAIEPQGLASEEPPLVGRQVRVAVSRRNREHFLGQRHGEENLNAAKDIMPVAGRCGNTP
jgi:hypothetical protein